MEYEDLEEYEGNKNACDNCDRKFKDGEVITVDDKGHVFCYSDGEGGCMIAFVFSLGKVCIIVANPMRFRGSKYHEPDNPMPNYPNMPIVRKDPEAEKKKIKDEEWLKKVLDGLNVS